MKLAIGTLPAKVWAVACMTLAGLGVAAYFALATSASQPAPAPSLVDEFAVASKGQSLSAAESEHLTSGLEHVGITADASHSRVALEQDGQALVVALGEDSKGRKAYCLYRLASGHPLGLACNQIEQDKTMEAPLVVAGDPGDGTWTIDGLVTDGFTGLRLTLEDGTTSELSPTNNVFTTKVSQRPTTLEFQRPDGTVGTMHFDSKV